jgi:hypothetical protein
MPSENCLFVATIREVCPCPVDKGFLRFRQLYSRPHDAGIRVYDEAGNVIETHKEAGDFKECVVVRRFRIKPFVRPVGGRANAGEASFRIDNCFIKSNLKFATSQRLADRLVRPFWCHSGYLNTR